MKHIATGLLFDKNQKLLIYLRDNIPTIPFPNFWDLFGGHVEEGETPEEALVRELMEELGISLTQYEKFREYPCLEGDAFPNTKYVFYSKIDQTPEELTLHEGQRLISIDLDERKNYKFANILGGIIDDFAKSDLVSKL